MILARSLVSCIVCIWWAPSAHTAWALHVTDRQTSDKVSASKAEDKGPFDFAKGIFGLLTAHGNLSTAKVQRGSGAMPPADAHLRGKSSGQTECFLESPVCRTQCCIDSAIKPTTHLRRLSDMIAHSGSNINMMVFGNSVSKGAGARAAVSFQETMQETFGSVNWEYSGERTSAAGGFAPEHLVSTVQAGEMPGFNETQLFIIQYEEFGTHLKGSEDLLRLILSAPQKPAVLAIQHCARFHLNSWSEEEAKVHDMPNMAGNKLSEVDLFEHYNVPFVSACRMMNTITDKRCEDAGEPDIKASDLPNLLFETVSLRDGAMESSSTVQDIWHYNRLGAGAEGCLLSELVSQGVRTYKGMPHDEAELEAALPPKLNNLTDGVSFQTAFMYSALLDNFKASSEGWSLTQGGKRKDKYWYTASAPGATMTFSTPAVERVRMEYYTHHELPMGLLEVQIDGGERTTIDACCPLASCEGTSKGQGMYRSTIIGDGLPKVEHVVHLRVLDRQSTTCAVLGNKFDIVSLIGESQLTGDE